MRGLSPFGCLSEAIEVVKPVGHACVTRMRDSRGRIQLGTLGIRRGPVPLVREVLTLKRHRIVVG